MKSGYIYIGTYFHRHGKDLSNLTEKKIGLSIDVPSRESALNSTKFTIGYTMLKSWHVDDMDKVERGIHALLDHDNLSGEWFEDEDGSLVDRVSKFMAINGYREHSNAIEPDPVASKVIKEIQDRSRIAELAGQQFSYTRSDITVTIEITPDGKFKCIQNNEIYETPNRAFVTLWKGNIVGTEAINAWTGPKNNNKRSIDQELSLLPAA